MTRDFKEALRHRRTYYHITDSSPISDEQIKEIIDFAVMNVPSAFNSQSTRIVLLLGKNHKKLWEITKETLNSCKTPSLLITTNFRFGHSKHLPCTSWRSGQCWKMPA